MLWFSYICNYVWSSTVTTFNNDYYYSFWQRIPVQKWGWKADDNIFCTRMAEMLKLKLRGSGKCWTWTYNEGEKDKPALSERDKRLQVLAKNSQRKLKNTEVLNGFVMGINNVGTYFYNDLHYFHNSLKACHPHIFFPSLIFWWSNTMTDFLVPVKYEQESKGNIHVNYSPSFSLLSPIYSLSLFHLNSVNRRSNPPYITIVSSVSIQKGQPAMQQSINVGSPSSRVMTL